MIRLRLTYQCFNGENNTKKLKIMSEIYNELPVKLEFRLPDGSSYPAGDVFLDQNGKAEYLLPRDVLYQNGTVRAQATVSLPDGRIEKSSLISFNVSDSINDSDNFVILLRNKRLYPLGGNTVSFVGDNSNYKLKFVGIENLGEIFAVFRKDGQKSNPVLIDENGYALVPAWVLKVGKFEVGLRAEGFASTALEMTVERSIVNDKDILNGHQDLSAVDQLLLKVNNIKYAKSMEIDDEGHLIFTMNDDTTIDCGVVRGNDGDKGEPGVTPEFEIGTVKSADSTEEPSVSITGTKEKPILNFVIPNADGRNIKLLETTTGFSYDLSPTDNTNIIRLAIKTCYDSHINTLKFPYKKTFLCEMPEGETTLFEIPSGMTIDLNGSEISLTANKLTKYKIFRMSYASCKNAVLKNGKIAGNKDKIYTENGTDYDYDGIKQLTNSTCEWGTAVSMGGENNRIENLEISQCRGDGVSFGGDTNFSNYLPSSFWQAGNVDGDGKFIESASSIITKHKWRTSEYKQFSDRICLRFDKSQTTIEYLSNIKYVFYKKISDEGVVETKNSQTSDVIDGTTHFVQFVGESGNEESFELVSAVTVIDGQEVEIPDEATNFSVIIQTKDASDYYSEENPDGKKAVFSVLCSFAARNCVVKNCKISHCGRQGITFGLAQFCEIDGCDISDIHGVSPGAGIDIEEGKRGSCHNIIRNCNIKDCTYAIIQAQGHSMLIENCIIDGRLHSEGGMRGNVIRQCTINGEARISSDGYTDILKPPVFEQNTVFGSLYARNAIVKDCSIHDSIMLDGESVAFSCRLVDIATFNGRFRDCVWTFRDGFTQCIQINGNIINPAFELINCSITGKDVWFLNHLLKANRIENCEINVKRITFGADIFKNNTVTYTVAYNNYAANLECPQIIGNTFNCTLDTPGYASSGNNYRSAICLKGETVTVQDNVFSTNSATPCVYVPTDCYVIFIENEGKTADGTVNYDVATYGFSYNYKINGFVGANKNLKAYACEALSEIKRFDKNSIEIAYAFENLERRMKILEYTADGFKTITDMLEYDSSEIKPKSDITLPEKILIGKLIEGATWLNGFNKHTELTDVVILDGSGYAVLRANAFNGCTNLKSIVFSESIQQVGTAVFSGCTALSSIDLRNVQALGSQCFYNCSALTTIHLPATLTSVNSNSFLRCTNLENVTMDKGFSVGLNLSVSTKYTADTLHTIIENLADLTGMDAQTLTLGTTNIAKLDDTHKTMLTDKNWTLA